MHKIAHLIQETSGGCLSRFPVVATSDPAELEAALQRTAGMTHFDTKPDMSGFAVKINCLELQESSLTYCSSATEMRVAFAPFVSQLICLTGHSATSVGQATAQVGSLETCVTSEGDCIVRRVSADFAGLVLRIDSQAVRRKLAAILGRDIDDELRFELQPAAGRPEVPSLCRRIMFLAMELDRSAGILPDAIVTALEQGLILSFLHTNRHQYSEALEQSASSAAPWQVRRAEEFIRANWDQAIDVERLASEIGVSARTIFDSFKRGRGYSPMEFLKRIRLERAHALLRKPDADATVVAIALRCGFQNLGHFARSYRLMFGELPSKTLSRSR